MDRLSLGLAITFIAMTFAHGAVLTWDTVPGDGTIISDGDGTWTSGVANWNDAGVDTVWAQTSATNGLHSAVFGGGTDGTYAINVGGPIGTQGITFNNSGYTLSATVARTVTVTSTGAMLVASGKSATIGNLVTVTKGADFNINGADAVAAGTLNIGSGGIVTTTGSFKLNLPANGSIVNVQSGGILRTTGGALTSTAIVIGGTVGSSTVNVEAGGIMSTGAGGIRVGGAAGGTGFLNVSGSVTNAGVVYIGFGSGSNGTLSINNGGTVDTSAGAFQMGQQGTSASTGRFNLNGGGTLFTKGVVLQSAATNVVKFDGGVLKAALDNTGYLPAVANSALHVHDGGVIFNSNGFNITVGGALAHSTLLGAAAIDGGLAKTGAGILTLTSASNTYTGATAVSAGTLLVNGALGNTAVTVADTATLGGTNGVIGTGTASVIVNSGGTLAPGSSIGSMTVNGSVSLVSGSTFAYELVGGGVTADMVDVNGALTINGATLSLSQLGGSYTPNDRFTLFAYDALGAGFTGFAGLPENAQFNQAGGVWKINYADPSPGLNGGLGTSYVTITAVPEPSLAALTSLAIGCGLLLRRRSAERVRSL